MTLQNHELGTHFDSAQFQVFFGNKESNIQSLQRSFTEFKFKRIQQTHGDRIVHTSPHSIDFASEADAHYTNEKNLALCVATADCIPVFICHQNPAWIMGIHAGWRGVQKRIVPKAVATLTRLGCIAKNLSVFIGPHIQKSSFEVSNDVRDLLLRSVSSSQNLNISEKNGDERSLVDLHLLVKTQLLECQVDPARLHIEFKDTFSNVNYHSFRRDKENSGRQLSWISFK